MKGVIFTEFVEMVEDQFSPEVADRMIENAELPSRGAYAATGTYDYGELVKLIGCLSAEADTPVPDLLVAGGTAMFERLAGLHDGMFEGAETAFQFLLKVESHIHVEVRKLYPEAELPSFEYEQKGADHLIMVYRSRRPFALFAEGLIRGCIEHFGEQIEVSHEDLSGGCGNHSRFELKRIVT